MHMWDLAGEKDKRNKIKKSGRQSKYNSVSFCDDDDEAVLNNSWPWFWDVTSETF